ncbi:MAG: hypothetical protein QF406_02520 [Verrucomicrobiota bacterium]|jgi:hypothetical protein|nr:hypothetical protein [Verrucomicrobiota bacterium]
MARIFHMTTREGDELATSVIAEQEAAGHETRVVDLTQVDPDGDYSVLLEEIFEADSVQVW